MELPKRAGDTPIAVELEKDKAYFWCTCGLSDNQPYCNGAHKGSDMTPQKFVAEKDGTHYLCACKATNNSPMCDGSHK